MAEALLTLANLTPDENKREELYARGIKEGGEALSSGLAEELGFGSPASTSTAPAATATVDSSQVPWFAVPSVPTKISSSVQTQAGVEEQMEVIPPTPVLGQDSEPGAQLRAMISSAGAGEDVCMDVN